MGERKKFEEGSKEGEESFKEFPILVLNYWVECSNNSVSC
jgi:hypothetical protein